MKNWFHWRGSKIIAEIREARGVILDKLATMEKTIMSGFDNLKAQVQNLAGAITAQTDAINQEKAAVDNEIAVVNDAIAKLKAGGLSDADAQSLADTIGAAIGNIQTSNSNIADSAAKLNSEAQNVQQ